MPHLNLRGAAEELTVAIAVCLLQMTNLPNLVVRVVNLLLDIEVSGFPNMTKLTEQGLKLTLIGDILGRSYTSTLLTSKLIKSTEAGTN